MIIFSCNPKTLNSLISPALEISQAGDRKAFSETFGKITIDAQKDSISFSASSDNMHIKLSFNDNDNSELNYTCDNPGVITVSSMDFSNAINSFKNLTLVEMVCNDENSLSIINKNDKEEFQIVPSVKEVINIPQSSDSFDQSLVINRQTFCEGIKNIKWALGVEEHKMKYFYAEIKYSKNSIQFSAGSGIRFSIWKSEKNHLVKCENSGKVYLYKTNINTIMNLIQDLQPDSVGIDYCEQKENISEHLVLTLKNHKIIITNFIEDMEWPNVNNIVNETRPNKIKINLESFVNAVDGIVATYNNDMKKEHFLHETSVETVRSDNLIKFSFDGNLKSVRKSSVEEWISKSEKDVSLKCSTSYLQEVCSKFQSNEKVCVEFYETSDKPIFFKSSYKIEATDENVEKILFFASFK